MVKAESTRVDKLTWFAAWSFCKSEENIGSVNNIAFFTVFLVRITFRLHKLINEQGHKNLVGKPDSDVTSFKCYALV